MRGLIASVAGALGLKREEAPSPSAALKEINYRGGLVIFSVPQSWVEEYEPEGGGTFYERGENTSTLRLNVITAQSPKEVDASSAHQVLQASRHSEIETLPTGNAIAKRVSRSTEQGQSITTYSWNVGNVVPPRHVRIAIFTYTILSTEEKSARTLSDLALLEASARAARFSSSLGQ